MSYFTLDYDLISKLYNIGKISRKFVQLLKSISKLDDKSIESH